jgi:NADPH:quinone reductase-like Zn-dependent oxidoreductase
MRGYSLMEFRTVPAVIEGAKKYVYDRLADGRFQLKIAKTFPLAQAREAYEYLASNEQVGKVVITV